MVNTPLLMATFVSESLLFWLPNSYSISTTSVSHCLSYISVARNKYVTFFICNTLKCSVILMFKKCQMSRITFLVV